MDFGQRSSQAAHTRAYFSIIEGCVSEYQRSASHRLHAKSGKRECKDIVLEGGTRRLSILHILWKPTYQMHSCFALLNLQQTGKLSSGNFEQQALPAAVKFAHAPEVSRKVSLFDEVSQCSLWDGCRLQINHDAASDKSIHQIGGHDYIADPKGRKEHLAESAGVDHPVLAVQPLQRCDWSARIMILAIAIVFDDPGPCGSCPFEQLQAARERQGHAKWELMGRGHVNHAR